MDNKAKNYQLVETIKPASLTGAGSRLYIGDQPQLRSLSNRVVQIKSITAYNAEHFPISPAGNTMCSVAQFINAFLVLNVAGKEQFLYIPLAEMNPIQGDPTAFSPNVREYFELDRILEIDWTKSYFQFGADPTSAVYSYALGVRYYNLPDDDLQTGSNIR